MGDAVVERVVEKVGVYELSPVAVGHVEVEGVVKMEGVEEGVEEIVVVTEGEVVIVPVTVIVKVPRLTVLEKVTVTELELDPSFPTNPPPELGERVGVPDFVFKPLMDPEAEGDPVEVEQKVGLTVPKESDGRGLGVIDRDTVPQEEPYNEGDCVTVAEGVKVDEPVWEPQIVAKMEGVALMEEVVVKVGDTVVVDVKVLPKLPVGVLDTEKVSDVVGVGEKVAEGEILGQEEEEGV